MSVEKIGLYKIGAEIEKLDIIFRDQPISDYGIDAQIETKEDNYASGKLIAVQIKSGETYFKESNGTSFIYRGERKHYDYWLNHSLPVVIMFYNPCDENCYWQIVNQDTVSVTGKKWKIMVPMDNLISKAKIELTRIANSQTEYGGKYNSFLLSKPFMNHLTLGGRVLLNVEEWINKSSGRGDFKLRIINNCGKEIQLLSRSFIGFGTKTYTNVFKELFPWAEIVIDKEFYKQFDEVAILNEDFEAASVTYYGAMGATINFSSFELVLPKNSISIERWMEKPENIRPFKVGGGEVAFYQLELKLNEIGKSFLLLDKFINEGEFYAINL